MKTSSHGRVYAIGNAHIDPVWIWDWREGMREVETTFRAAVEKLDREPDLLFTASSAAYYAWIEAIDPQLFERIRRHVEAGRWLVVGGEWVEPDCNLPSGESVCRHLLYSQQYLARAFGRPAEIAYNVDSFGHAGSLPQLFRKAGLRGYVMMRPQPHEKEIPGQAFRWRGVDGTEIPTYRIPFGYETGFARGDRCNPEAEREQILSRGRSLLEDAQRDGLPRMLFFGVGDHGGGPTQAAVEAVRALAAESEGRVAFGHPQAYFDALAEQGGSDVPLVEGDLHKHAPGCYSVVSEIKADNAHAERELVMAEKLASLCRMTTGRDLQVTERLRQAWQHVLFAQFHDSLGGTCTQEATGEIRRFYALARATADEVTAAATQVLASQVDTWRPGTEHAERYCSLNPFSAHYPVPVVVWNPLAWPVRVPVTIPHATGGIRDDEGNPVLAQSVASREATRYPVHTLAVVDLPAFGQRLFWLEPPNRPGASDIRPTSVGEVRVRDAAVLENQTTQVRIDPETGAVIGLRAFGREWIAGEGLRPVVLTDWSDTWSHGIDAYQGPEEPWTCIGVRVTERGPVRATVRLTLTWGRSILYEDVSLYADFPYVDVHLYMDWHERHRVCKFVVPTTLRMSALWVGLPYGATQRSADGGEDVMQRWVDLSDASGGLTALSDSTYGYDCKDGRIRLTLLRSPRFADHGTDWAGEDSLDDPVTDQGVHVVALRFVPHPGTWQEADVGRLAEEHGLTFPVATETWHRGPLGHQLSALAVAPHPVDVPVVKRSEDGTGWILRVCERGGSNVHATVRLPFLDRTWQGELHGFEVKTLFLPDDATQPVREVRIDELGRLG